MNFRPMLAMWMDGSMIAYCHIFGCFITDLGNFLNYEIFCLTALG